VLPLDDSAWARLDSASLPADRRAELADMLENGELAVSIPFLLEAGWSASGASHHDQLVADLRRLPYLPLDDEAEELALSAQRDLAQRGHHRSAIRLARPAGTP
jgi:predicted nucleic acid-binding protein